MGHARALLTLPVAQAETLARQAADEGWTVREIERRVQQAQKQSSEARKPEPTKHNPDVAVLERELSDSLGAEVNLKSSRGGRGKLVISYHSLDQLDGILERLRR